MLVRNKINELLFTKTKIEELYEEYKDKPRGEIFVKNLAYWERKLRYQLGEVKALGKGKIVFYQLSIINKAEKKETIRIAYSQEFSSEDIMNLVQIETQAKQVNNIKKYQEIKLGTPI